MILAPFRKVGFRNLLEGLRGARFLFEKALAMFVASSRLVEIDPMAGFCCAAMRRLGKA